MANKTTVTGKKRYSSSSLWNTLKDLGQASAPALAAAANIPKSRISALLHVMLKRGQIERVGRGLYSAAALSEPMVGPGRPIGSRNAECSAVTLTTEFLTSSGPASFGDLVRHITAVAGDRLKDVKRSVAYALVDLRRRDRVTAEGTRGSYRYALKADERAA